MQKFIQTRKKKLTIPHAVMEMSGFEENSVVDLCALDDAVVVLKRNMTAMELVRAVDSLQRLVVDLNRHLADVCGPCEDCGDGECPVSRERNRIDVPEEVRREAGIPPDAKLCACASGEAGMVAVFQAEYRHDLTDVPEWERTVLASMGACMGSLEELLMNEEIVYG